VIAEVEPLQTFNFHGLHSAAHRDNQPITDQLHRQTDHNYTNRIPSHPNSQSARSTTTQNLQPRNFTNMPQAQPELKKVRKSTSKPTFIHKIKSPNLIKTTLQALDR
jgi:hypothetical protein